MRGHIKSFISEIKKWIIASRLETISLAIGSVVLGSVLASFAGAFNWTILILSSITASLLQIICNLANDYGDFLLGADSDKSIKPPSALQTNLVTLKQLKCAIKFLIVPLAISGVALLYQSKLSNNELILFASFGVLSAIASIGYTIGHRPYGYRGFGDIAVFTFFGLLGVGGTFYLHTHQLNLVWLLPSLSFGSLVVGVLNVNNIRDIETDALARKNTIPVRIGKKSAVLYHWLIISTSIISTFLFIFLYSKTRLPYLYIIVIPLLLKHAFEVSKKKPHELTKELGKLVGIIMLFVLLLSIGLCFGF